MTSQHYTLIVAVAIIVLLGIFFAMSSKNTTTPLENPSTHNIPSGNEEEVTSSTTTR